MDSYFSDPAYSTRTAALPPADTGSTVSSMAALPTHTTTSNNASMGPPMLTQSQLRPTEPRKFVADDWIIHKDEISHLYEENTLEQVRANMRDKYRLEATPKQYKDRIKKWNLDKNIKTVEMEAIIRKLQQREQQGKKSNCRVKGRRVELRKIDRYKERQKESLETSDEIDIYMDIDSAATPAGVSVYTASDTGTPRGAPSPMGDSNQEASSSSATRSWDTAPRWSMLKELAMKYEPSGFVDLDAWPIGVYLTGLADACNTYPRDGVSPPWIAMESLAPVVASSTTVKHSIIAIGKYTAWKHAPPWEHLRLESEHHYKLALRGLRAQSDGTLIYDQSDAFLLAWLMLEKYVSLLPDRPFCVLGHFDTVWGLFPWLKTPGARLLLSLSFFYINFPIQIYAQETSENRPYQSYNTELRSLLVVHSKRGPESTLTDVDSTAEANVFGSELTEIS